MIMTYIIINDNDILLKMILLLQSNMIEEENMTSMTMSNDYMANIIIILLIQYIMINISKTMYWKWQW